MIIVMQNRPIRAIIKRDALRHNISAIKKLSGGSKVFGVVKADGYGHGLKRIYHGLSALDGLAVIEMEAASYLRAQGDNRPILLLEGVFSPQEMRDAIRLNLDLVVHSFRQIELLRQIDLGKPLNVFMKVNSGMNRLGFPVDDVAQCYRALKDCAAVKSITTMTHYADADNERGVSWQDAKFSQAVDSLGIPTSKSNSAALIRFGSNAQGWIRPGIMLYGVSPVESLSALSMDLMPVMTLKSEIISVQNLNAGDRVGYGGTYTAKCDLRIGIVAGGYGDGYPRAMRNGSPVLVEGVRVPLVGRVSMDSLAVDITKVPAANVGSSAVLWGEGLPVEEVAEHAGTISYELLTRVTRRVPFVCFD
ncbi:MAG: alanine racemase [Betaproteobacteria bacterium TMED22]|nr:MAG: alanine racemase [Betaproteobacteria bacterium TMED22]